MDVDRIGRIVHELIRQGAYHAAAHIAAARGVTIGDEDIRHIGTVCRNWEEAALFMPVIPLERRFDLGYSCLQCVASRGGYSDDYAAALGFLLGFPADELETWAEQLMDRAIDKDGRYDIAALFAQVFADEEARDAHTLRIFRRAARNGYWMHLPMIAELLPDDVDVNAVRRTVEECLHDGYGSTVANKTYLAQYHAAIMLMDPEQRDGHARFVLKEYLECQKRIRDGRGDRQSSPAGFEVVWAASGASADVRTEVLVAMLDDIEGQAGDMAPDALCRRVTALFQRDDWEQAYPYYLSMLIPDGAAGKNEVVYMAWQRCIESGWYSVAFEGLEHLGWPAELTEAALEQAVKANDGRWMRKFASHLPSEMGGPVLEALTIQAAHPIKVS